MGALFGSRNQALLYVKGGFAVGDKIESSFEGKGFDYDDCFLGCEVGNDFAEFARYEGTESKDSGYGFGGTVGAGLEYKLTQNFSIGAEYQFTFLNYSGSHDVTAVVEEEVVEGVFEEREVTFKNKFQDIGIHAVKAKATIHFN